MAKVGLDRQLLELFTGEVKERSSELEHHLLALEKAPGTPERRTLLERLLRLSHSLKGAAGLVEVRPIEAICHRMEDLFTFLLRAGRPPAKEDFDALFAAADAVVEAGRALERAENPSSDQVDAVLRQLGERLETGADTRGEDRSGPKPIPEVPVLSLRASDADGSLRLSGDRLDLLLYRSGELLTAGSRLRLRAEQASFLRERFRRRGAGGMGAQGQGTSVEAELHALASDLAEDARQIGGLVRALDHEIRYSRMQRFSEACQGLHRLVRDVGAASGKSAELHISGGEVEIDRSIIAGLQDSLRHLVRNAMGHGIEPPDVRRAAGKPETGRIVLSATLFGDRLQVHVEDDGRGFDLAALGKAAGEEGLAAAPDEGERLRQAFAPGVSTSAELTNLSGRGIGLDIVRRAVEGMRGSVELSHTPGKGAQFTLSLPLTLATVQALGIVAGGQVFAIDTTSVRRVSRIPIADLPASGQPNRLQTAHGSAHILDLASWFGLPGRRAAEPAQTVPAVFVGAAGDETAVLVEEILGQQELLTRALGPRLENVRCYSGGDILPDGRIALLLNVAVLVEAAVADEAYDAAAYAVASEGPRRRVLVVDDSPSVRALEKLILETAGYEVTVAADGSEAWERLRTEGADIVVADVDMPAMDGFALTKAIRRSYEFAGLPVILITGRDNAEDKTRGLDAGATAYFAKSGFDQQLFLEAVREVI